MVVSVWEFLPQTLLRKKIRNALVEADNPQELKEASLLKPTITVW